MEIRNTGKGAGWKEIKGQINFENIEMKLLVDIYVEMSHCSLSIYNQSQGKKSGLKTQILELSTWHKINNSGNAYKKTTYSFHA